MECRLVVDQSGIQLEATLQIDRGKFTDTLAEEINTFWGGSEYRLDECGSHFTAALKLYGQQFFQLIAFNNFKTKDWLTDQFDWSLPGKGVEGFPSLAEAGVTVDHIDTWFVYAELIDVEITEEDGE